MILVFSEKYYPEGGGAELVTHNIVLELIRRGYKVVVITGTPRKIEINTDKLRYIYEPLLKPMNKIYQWSVANMLAYKYRGIIAKTRAVYIPGIIYPIIPVIKRINSYIEVILHLHNYQPIKYSQFYISASTNKELLWEDLYLLMREYGYKSLALSPIISFIRKYLNLYIKYVDKIIAPNKSFKEIICRFTTRFNCRKIIPIYNPINIGHIPVIKKRKNMIVYLGGEKYIKGYPIALITANKLRNIVDSKIVFLGDYKQRYKLGNTVYLGKITHHKTIQILASSKTLLFPSLISEPCPMSILEAFYTGTIPIAFNLPTIHELYSLIGLNKYLCKPYSIECLIDKIFEIHNLPDDELVYYGTSIRQRALKVFDARRSLDMIINTLNG